MKKLSVLSLLFLLCSVLVWGEPYRRDVAPTKNLIVMIPDGTSMGVVSSARWYQIYNKLGSDRLAIDPYLCGTVKTFCSNAPIGDSAPTTSCYMTGMPQKVGNVAIYPECDEHHDLCPVDPSRAYQPLATVLEAMKYCQGKSTGLVVTCIFPHATPADCSAHHYNRSSYDCIASQMAYNNLDVMFGGGASNMTDDIRGYFRETGVTLIEKDAAAFRAYDGDGPLWALFHGSSLPYDLDRDDARDPSIEEMTRKAIELLSKNDKGFFLMVEGSKIDFAAHDNDAIGCITDYLAFDRAVRVAMEFAEKDGNTTVVVLPDHGNSGFSLGNERSSSGYNVKTIDELFEDVSKYRVTGSALAGLLKKTPPADIGRVVKEHTSIELKQEELDSLLKSSDYKMGDQSGKNKFGLGRNLINIMNSRTYFGFTTRGHTGEDVFLAAYHPQGHLPLGMNTNTEINAYLRAASGLPQSLEELTDAIYAKHTDVFAGMECSIAKTKERWAELTIKKDGKTLVVPSFKSVVYLDGKPVRLKSVVVYIDKNETFYLPKELAQLL